MVDPFSWVGAPLIAAAVAFIVMEIGVRIAANMRRRDFLRFENSTNKVIEKNYPLPTPSSPAAANLLKSLGALVSTYHSEAIALQNAYHASIVRAAVSLVLAFCAMAVSVSPLREFERFHVTALWLETILLLSVLVHFWSAKKISVNWIKSRTKVELLRQFQFLYSLFPTYFRADSGVDLTSAFETYRRKIEAMLGGMRKAADIARQAMEFWSSLRYEIEKALATDTQLQQDAVVLYTDRRILRQLGWFSDSALRLKHDAERRRILLQCFYLCALVIAAIRLTASLFDSHLSISDAAFTSSSADDWFVGFHAALLPMLLITTGLSAALTAYYINQNARSLIHRYALQKRAIEEWIEEAKMITLWPSHKRECLDPRSASYLLHFEDLMIGELVDWISITDHDTIEIAL